jgi:hypothetical protein
MVTRIKKNAPALKHGGYSATALLPGEDTAALKKLHDDLIDELSPTGPLEEDIVASIVRLVWRKRHLATFRVVGPKRDEKVTNRADVDLDKARKEFEASREKRDAVIEGRATPEEVDSFWREGSGAGISRFDTPQEAMRKYYAFVERLEDSNSPEQRFLEIGEITTMEQFMSVLAVEERIDTMIDRCLKRLLFLRGLKSLAPAKSASQPTEQKRLRKV